MTAPSPAPAWGGLNRTFRNETLSEPMMDHPAAGDFGSFKKRPRPLLAAVAAVALRTLGGAPLGMLRALGSICGALLYFAPARPRRVTLVNLALCFPEMAAAERRALARRSLVQTCRGALELAPAWRWDPARLGRLWKDTRGLDLLEGGLAKGKGVILACLHLGSWELGGVLLSDKYRATAFYRPPFHSNFETVVDQGRRRFGGATAPAGMRGIRILLEALKRGEIILVFPDQDPGKGSGVFAPLFGVSTRTGVLVSRLASRTGAPVFFFFCERLPGARGFRLHFREADAETASRDAHAAAAALNRGIEQCIRDLPEQYLWTYKRFRFAPPGEPPRYPRNVTSVRR